jgi:hypothetical protein
MDFTIYKYEGSQDTLITEKFFEPYNTYVYMYVGRDVNGSLGFDVNATAVSFVKTLLDQRVTVSFPDLEKIDSKEKIEQCICNLRGITFLNNHELIKEEYDKYLLYQTKIKKNTLLARYNKPLENIEVPTIANWYDSVSRKYTNEFLNYCKNHSIDFITWAFSDFGSYFFSFKDVTKEVMDISKHSEIHVKIVDDFLKMPYH